MDVKLICFILDQLNIIKKYGWADPKRQQLLSNICNSLKPVFYNEHTYIVREGDPIDAVFLVTDGIAWTYTSSSKGEGKETSSRQAEPGRLEKGKFFGEELLAWVWDPTYKDYHPFSSRTIKTHGKVEAFALMANDLKEILYSSLTRLNPKQTEVKAASRVQRRWRIRKHKKTDDRVGASGKL